MATSQITEVVEHLRRGMLRRDGAGLTDGQLLECYVSQREEAAFAALVRRHAPMVWGVCRRVVGGHHDAEDAFQATFIVLVRKASSVVPREMVANWLYGVAYQTAIKARAMATRRKAREKQVTRMPEPAAADGGVPNASTDLIPHLDRELSRLPDLYRIPVILCDLEGKTHKEAARQLGCAEGTVSARLSKARAMLAKRLARPGPLSAGAVAVPPEVVAGAIKTATLVAAGKTLKGAACGLAQGVIKTMLLTKLKCATAILLAVGGIAFGVFAMHDALATDGADEKYPVPAPAAFHNAGSRHFQAGQAQKTDAERILGTWRFVKIVAEGTDDSSGAMAVLARLTFFKDGKAVISAPDTSKPGTYKLEGQGQLVFDKGDFKSFGPTLYKFDGDDRLSLCFTMEGTKNRKRPTEFNGDKGSNQCLIVLVRAKPGEEKPTAQEIAKYSADVDKIKETAARQISADYLHQIGIAMHNYHDAHNALPLHAIYSKDGNTPLLSWRVAILPFIDQDILYKAFKLDEPWDSAHNMKYIAKMPQIYEPVGFRKKNKGMTYYQVFTGPDTLFNGIKKMRFVDIKDGPSLTIMAIEANDPVIWTKPADLVLPKEKEKMPALGGLFKDTMGVLFADGSVSFLPKSADPVTLRALVTPHGGEKVDLDKLLKKD